MHNKEFKELMNVLKVAAKDEALFEEFLKDLLTPQELREIPTRWEIVKRLYKGETHATIAGTLKIGIGTVTRGANELKDKNGGFMKMLKKMYPKK